jgi:hypothetical protein
MNVLLVEQNDKPALQLAQCSYVMEGGAITLSGAAKELLGSNAVQRAYLGAECFVGCCLLLAWSMDVAHALYASCWRLAVDIFVQPN